MMGGGYGGKITVYDFRNGGFMNVKHPGVGQLA